MTLTSSGAVYDPGAEFETSGSWYSVYSEHRKSNGSESVRKCRRVSSDVALLCRHGSTTPSAPAGRETRASRDFVKDPPPVHVGCPSRLDALRRWDGPKDHRTGNKDVGSEGLQGL